MPSRRIPFSVHISYLFIGLLAVFAIILNAFQFSETSRLITTEVGHRFELIGERATEDIQHTFSGAALSSALLAKQRLTQEAPCGRADPARAFVCHPQMRAGRQPASRRGRRSHR